MTDFILKVCAGLAVVGLVGVVVGAVRYERRRRMAPPTERRLVHAPSRGELDAELWFLEAAGWKPCASVARCLDGQCVTHVERPIRRAFP